MEEVLKELDNMGIKYELVEHKPVYTIEDMNNLDSNIFKGAEICKNLFLRDQKGKRHFLVVLCSEKQADLSKIQETIFSSKLSFASPERLKKYLGLEPGHVSPMGLINDKENMKLSHRMEQVYVASIIGYILGIDTSEMKNRAESIYRGY